MQKMPNLGLGAMANLSRLCCGCVTLLTSCMCSFASATCRQMAGLINFDQNWSKLIKINQIWSKLINFDHHSRCLDPSPCDEARAKCLAMRWRTSKMPRHASKMPRHAMAHVQNAPPCDGARAKCPGMRSRTPKNAPACKAAPSKCPSGLNSDLPKGRGVFPAEILKSSGNFADKTLLIERLSKRSNYWIASLMHEKNFFWVPLLPSRRAYVLEEVRQSSKNRVVAWSLRGLTEKSRKMPKNAGKCRKITTPSARRSGATFRARRTIHTFIRGGTWSA